jgi:hypothetical protein
MFEIPVAVGLYCAFVAAAFLSLWLYYDGRDRRWLEGERRRTTFSCIRCDRLYTAGGVAELCPCPRCGHQNSRLRF